MYEQCIIQFMVIQLDFSLKFVILLVKSVLRNDGWFNTLFRYVPIVSVDTLHNCRAEVGDKSRSNWEMQGQASPERACDSETP